MGKEGIDLTVYEALCKAQFAKIDKDVLAVKGDTGRIAEKVFNGFGNEIGRLHKAVAALRSVLYWFIGVAALAMISSLLNIMIHFGAGN